MIEELKDKDCDNDNHPVKPADRLDVVVETSRGVTASIVIANPISSDQISRSRIQQKLESYVGDLRSHDWNRKYGVATKNNRRIVVGIHPASDPNVFLFLESFRSWVEQNDICFEIDTSPEVFGIVTQ